MARKPRFPPEPVTRPDSRRPKGPTTHRSGPAPKDARERSEAPTLPPPAEPGNKPSGPAPRARRAQRSGDSGVSTKSDMAAATIDEVTADLSKDPRSEHDDEDEQG
jgi:hypothetical protein